MRKILANIFHKTTAITAILAVVMLNFSAVLQCGQMLIEDDCCHITNTVKPCCLNNAKVTVTERFTSHCGCSMKESGHNADMYADLSSGRYKNTSQSSIELKYSDLPLSSIQRDLQTENYSPPIVIYGNVYLYNMNLRI
jgi:hypothetical protein